MTADKPHCKMPEFERKKRRSLSERQLYEEYYGGEKKKNVKKPSSQKNKNKNGAKSKPAGFAEKESRIKKDESVKRENPPVSPERRRAKESRPKENAVRIAEGGTAKKRSAAPKKAVGGQGKPKPRGKRDASAQKKRKKHGSYVLYYFLCGTVAVAVVVILSVTVLFNISVFEVEGETDYSREEIIAASGIKEGDNLLRTDTEKAEKRILSELVYIDTAKISRGFPNKIIIKTEPARPAAGFIVSGKYYLVSELGRLLEIADDPKGCPVVKGYVLDPEKESNPETKTVIGGPLADDEEKRVSSAQNIIAFMERYGLDEDYTLDVTDTLNIKLTYDGRVEMELGTTAAMDSKIYNASLLMENEIAENEKCVLILTNPNRVPKRPIRDGDAGDDGYVVTEKTEDTSASDTGPPEETTPE